MSVSSRGVSTCVETARPPVSGGGGRNAPAQKSGGRCKESQPRWREICDAQHRKNRFSKTFQKLRDEEVARAIRWHSSPTRRVCQVGAVGRGRRDEPKQARERRAGGDHRQRHLRPVLPARRLRSVPGRSEDHGRGWGARQASATVHGRLPRRERVGGAGPRPAVRRDERQGHRDDRYVRTNPTNEPEPLATTAAQRSPASVARCLRRPEIRIRHFLVARS